MNLFTWVDYSIVAGTLLFSLFIGIYYAFQSKNAKKEDLLVGGRSMGIIPIACSMLVTYLSAITILGYPSEVYGYGIQIFISTLTFVFFVPFSMYFFMGVFYNMKMTSVYEYLEKRFESIAVRRFASFIFIMQMSVFMGVCLFAPSIALSTFMGLEIWQSVIGLGLCATVYTSIGGIKAVIWTDVFQLVMILFGMVSILYKGFDGAGGLVNAFQIAEKHGRLVLFDFTVDPFMRLNFLNIFLGQGFAIFCLFGTHQPQVQRYSSLPSLKKAVQATLFAVPLNILTVFFCLIAGVAIFSTYAGCDPMALGYIKRVDAIVPYYISKELKISGMVGLFTACVFSASLSTLSSGLNSLAAVLYEDFMSQSAVIKRMNDKQKANVIRVLAVGFGALSIALAFVAQNLGSILAATITAMGALSGPLGAVFAMGLLMPFVNRSGAVIGMTVGFVSMVWITTNAFMLDKSHTPLPFSAENCTHLLSNSSTSFTTASEDPELEWPEKLYTVSYILYPFVGGMITFAVSIIVSIFTCGCRDRKNVADEFLHPLVRSKTKVPMVSASIHRNLPSSEKNVDRLANPSNGGSKELSYRTYKLVGCDDDPSLMSPMSPNGVTSPTFGTYKSNSSEQPLLYRMPSNN